MSKRKVVGQTKKEDMSPEDVEEFRTDIVDAGSRLADLLVVPYPDAHLVDDALFAVTEIVKCFGLEGRWVTSWASSARKEFLATASVREVSGCVAFIGMTANFVLSTYSLL
jgi:ABC-type taurine transport system ATPase subunit